MNKLFVGTADLTEPLLRASSPGFLLIDDGPIADAFLEQFPRAKLFDPLQHSFNPLNGMDYKRARDFVTALYTASPEGKDTLTVRNGKRALLRLLLDNPTRLDKLTGDTKDPAIAEALATVQDLLVSPVLRQVFCGTKQFDLSTSQEKWNRRSVVAKLDRTVLGDFDAFILGSLLIGQSHGQVVVPDFDFYGRPLHLPLIRQNRLICGVKYLPQLGPEGSVLRQAVLGIKDKTGKGCTYDDASTLANYVGLMPGDGMHTVFVGKLMG